MSVTERSYILIGWSPSDIQVIRPKWSLEKCKDWLEDNERYLDGLFIAAGWAILDDSITATEDEE